MLCCVASERCIDRMKTCSVWGREGWGDFQASVLVASASLLVVVGMGMGDGDVLCYVRAVRAPLSGHAKASISLHSRVRTTMTLKVLHVPSLVPQSVGCFASLLVARPDLVHVLQSEGTTKKS